MTAPTVSHPPALVGAFTRGAFEAQPRDDEARHEAFAGVMDKQRGGERSAFLLDAEDEDRLELTEDSTTDSHLSAPSTASTALGQAEIRRHVGAINQTLDPHEQLDCAVLMTEPWTVDNDLITPTFKVKRNKIEDVFAANYERWVSTRKPVIWHKG